MAKEATEGAYIIREGLIKVRGKKRSEDRIDR